MIAARSSEAIVRSKHTIPLHLAAIETFLISPLTSRHVTVWMDYWHYNIKGESLVRILRHVPSHDIFRNAVREFPCARVAPRNVIVQA